MKFTVDEANPNETLTQVLEFIHGSLASQKLTAKELTDAELMCEESLVRLFKYSDFSKVKYVRVNIRHFFGNITVDLTVPGQEFDFTESFQAILKVDDNESIEAIQNILLRLFSPNLRYKHSRNFNAIRIRAVRSEYSGLYMTFGALFAAIIAGLLLRAFAPESVCMSLNDNVFTTIRTIFMNGLKTCAVPIVFCSIAASVADAGNLSGMQRSGIRLMQWFLLGQIAAVCVGFGVVMLFGTGKGAGLVATSSVQAGASVMSAKDTIIGLIPDNLIRPFLEGNMLQLIILAVLAGMAAGSTGAEVITKTLNELNIIFMRITSYFMSMIPLVIFCSIASIIITTGLDTVLSLLGLLLTLWTGYAVMHVIICLAVRFVAGLSPVTLYRKSLPAIITAFSTCSSSAALPDMMRCAETLGIPQKLYSFGLPLGILVNKVSACMYYAALVLSATNMYGVNLSVPALLGLSVSVVFMCLAAPNLPGAGLVSMSVLLSQAGIPLEFMGLIMSIDTLCDMTGTPTKCVGNLAEEVIVAKLENELDVEVYSQP